MYIVNSTLDDCGGIRPRYQQVGGTVFLWSDGDWWYGSRMVCVADPMGIRQFYGRGYTAAASPDLVAAGTWRTVTVDDVFVTHPPLTVNACG